MEIKVNTEKILMFGRDGLISFRIRELFVDKIISLGHQDVDFNSSEQITKILNQYSPGLIINASAYTAVDLAEDEITKSNQINGYAVGVIGDWAKKNNAFVIHFSTDYVFNGEGSVAYKPDDQTHPINQYGRSKLLGENLLKQSGCQNAIFRISWIYDRERGKNFYQTMKRLMAEKEEIKVVDDQLGMPTEARWVAEKIVNLIQLNRLESGIFHLAPPGVKSWFDFACEIKNELKFNCRVLPIKSDQYVTKAKRPKWSKLVDG